MTNPGRLFLAAVALALASCAHVPEIDRLMLQSGQAPVRLEGVHGPLSREQSKAILDRLQARTPGNDLLARHVAIEEAIADHPLTVGNAVSLLEDGPETYAAMLAALRAARRHVHMESYIFEDDDVGREFARAMLERAKAGVDVRLVVDAVGSMHTPPEFLKGLRDGGIRVAVYNPINAGTVITRGLEVQKRDHRKLLVVDGAVAFLGGINISGKYTPGGIGGQRGGIAGSQGGGPSGGAPSGGARTGADFDQRPWRDTQVRIEGPVVGDLEKSFQRIWSETTHEAPGDSARATGSVPARGNHLVRIVEGVPGRQDANAMYVDLISAIDNAERSVTITMAYFVPHDALLESLRAAARRGIPVRILLPSRTDSWLVLYAGRAYYEDLLEAGVKLYERENRLLHAKTATIDGVWSTVGSTNLDWRSLAYNEELNAVVLGTDFARELEEDFAGDLRHSKEITREAWARRGVADRTKEALARAWALLL